MLFPRLVAVRFGLGFGGFGAKSCQNQATQIYDATEDLGPKPEFSIADSGATFDIGRMPRGV